ncbi:hypothetical protein CPC08DRAFT_688059 [Agrocybe pediades]|nr:hypothetical protein CPC08DRAFT_688059 [Agrocybe pediades]
MSEHHHVRSPSHDSQGIHRSHPSSPPPSQKFHPSLLPHSIPTPSLVESVAGGAHYSGVNVEPGSVLKHRRSSTARPHNVLKHDHKRVLDDLTELYCCRPSVEIFERSWNKDAVFEDPLCICKGYHQYAAQWYAMLKFFSSSEQLSKRVMSSTDSPNRFIYQQTMEYTTRLFNKKKVVESIIIADLDENDKIVRLVDQWHGKDMPTWFGASFLRSLNAKLSPWIFHVPKKAS